MTKGLGYLSLLQCQKPLPLLPEDETISSQKLSDTIRTDLFNTAKRWSWHCVGLAAVAIGSGKLVQYLSSYDGLNATITVIALATVYFIPRIKYQFEKSHELYQRHIKKQFGREDVGVLLSKLPHEISSKIFLPPNPMGIDNDILTQSLKGFLLKVSVIGGNRIKVDIEGVPIKYIPLILRIINATYPQVMNIGFVNYDNLDETITPILRRMVGLRRLSFNSCLLSETLVKQLIQAIKPTRIDLKGCDGIDADILEDENPNMVITRPTGSSNKSKLLKPLHDGINELSKQQLIYVLQSQREKMIENMRGQVTTNESECISDINTLLKTLNEEKPVEERALVDRADTIRTLISKLSPILNPVKREITYEKNRLAEFLQSIRHNAAFDSSFNLNLRGVLIDDSMCSEVLSFLSLQSNLRGLNLSHTYITGSCLLHLAGMSLCTLELRCCENLNNEHLWCLQSLPELMSLDLSSNKLTDYSLDNGISKLKRLKRLFLNNCRVGDTRVRDEIVTTAIFPLMGSLELLTLDGFEDVDASKMSHNLMAISQRNPKTPFIVTYNHVGFRRADISTCEDRGKIFAHLSSVLYQQDKDTTPISVLCFAPKSNINGGDFIEGKGFLSSPIFDLTKLDLCNVKIEDDIVMKKIVKWKLCNLRLPGNVIITIKNMKAGPNPTADKITVSTSNGITKETWQFLKAFHSIEEVSFANIRTLNTTCEDERENDFLCIARLSNSVKIHTIDLKNTNVSSDDLQLLEGKPKKHVLELMRKVDYIDLEKTGSCDDKGSPHSPYFVNWHPLSTENDCDKKKILIKMPNGEIKEYNF
jgi:hypothetical protein